MSKREPSLFWRLVFRVGIVLVLGSGLLVSAAWYYGHAAAERPYDQVLRAAARQIAAGVTHSDGQLVVNLPVSAFDLLGIAPRDRVFYSILNADGVVVSGYEGMVFGVDLASLRGGARFLSGTYRGLPVRAFAIARALPDPDRNGWAYVILAQTTEARDALAREITNGAMVIVAIMVFIALAGTILAVRYAMRPVAILAETLRVRDPEDLTSLDAPVPKELKPFIGAINFFMHRLDERVIRLQHFIADAAHQIRTPLTALSAQIDMLGETPDPSRVEHIRHRTEELSVLTNQLLTHAMVIHRSATAPLVRVDLVEVARTAFNQAIPMTVDPEIIIAFEASQIAIDVQGDALSLREAIANIISNALHHGALSKLDVRVWAHDGRATVEVEDDGPGIPEENWETVTKRFNVADSGRPRVSGLGFAIAAEVAAAHQGLIKFRRDPGFSVILEIPTSARAA